MASSRFLEVCQRGLSDLPDFPCQNGINAIQHKGDKKKRCPWYINDKISCYCWFKYDHLIKMEYGKMFEHTFEEIAKLDNCTATYIKITEDKAKASLLEKINSGELKISTDIDDFKKKDKPSKT